MEPWEALDVDDSDLVSLLRPCKRLHHHSSQITTTSTASTIPTAAPANSQQQQQQQQNPHYHIPGPAGQVQAAMMLRKTHQVDEPNPIPTQEYIRKAVENAPTELDQEFQSHPWLSALEFLGMVDGVVSSTPLSSIKKWVNVGKVDKVVAVIKSCTPNDLGGLMVTLKDPTGTIDASIHHKVVTESEFGKDISLGSVLILQKVAVFAPSHSAYYLNVTLRNLVKVFSKCSGSPSKQKCPANEIRYPTPNIDSCGKANRRDNGSTIGRGTTKEILEDMRRYTDKRRIEQDDNQAEKENKLPGSLECRDKVSLNHIAVAEREAFASKQAVEVRIGDAISEESADYSRGFMDDKSNQPKEANLEGSCPESRDVTNSIPENTDDESLGTNEVLKRTQPPISKASLPQWTDEQLEELFANDGEDDGYMF